jgi:hypothetical protein
MQIDVSLQEPSYVKYVQLSGLGNPGQAHPSRRTRSMATEATEVGPQANSWICWQTNGNQWLLWEIMGITVVLFTHTYCILHTYIYIYIYVYVCIYLCICIYIYIYCPMFMIIWTETYKNYLPANLKLIPKYDWPLVNLIHDHWDILWTWYLYKQNRQLVRHVAGTHGHYLKLVSNLLDIIDMQLITSIRLGVCSVLLKV